MSECERYFGRNGEREKALEKFGKKLQITIEDRLVKAYNRIQNNVKNGLADVPIEEVLPGSFFTIPPQVSSGDSFPQMNY